MISPDSAQIFELSDYIGKLGNILGEYIDFNKGNLSQEQRNCLYDSQIELARLAGEINITGVNLVFEDVQSLLNQIGKITDGMEKTVKKALAVQDALKIATGLVTMATAIATSNAKAIVESTVGLGDVLKIKL